MRSIPYMWAVGKDAGWIFLIGLLCVATFLASTLALKLWGIGAAIVLTVNNSRSKGIT